MNRENLEVLAQWLEAGAPHRNNVDKFDMHDGIRIDACGTACCIAGAAIQFFGNGEAEAMYAVAIERYTERGVGKVPFYPNFRGERTVLSFGAELLDLTPEQAADLFTPCRYEYDWDKITPAHAATAIRNFLKTGEVNWSHLGDL